MKKISIIVLLFIGGMIHTAFSQGTDKKVYFRSMDWAPDGKSFVYTAMAVNEDFSDFNTGKWGLYRYTFENQNIEKLDTGILSASFHPDGTKLAYGKKVDENWDIYVRDLGNGQVERLTSHGANDSSPAWSNDGTLIAFSSTRGDEQFEIFVMHADGSGIRQITHSDSALSMSPDWSYSDNRIVYFRRTGEDVDQVYITDSTGSFFRSVTGAHQLNYSPTWTPAGRILYVTGERKVALINPDGSEKRILEYAEGMYAKHSPVKSEIIILDPELETIFIYYPEKSGMEALIEKGALLKAARK